MMEARRYGEIELLQFRTLGSFHGFTTRRGGASAGGYDSLNLGRHTGDSLEAVEANYARLFEVLEIDPLKTAVTQQVHSNHIVHVQKLERFTEFTATDGLMTDTTGITLMTYYADCTPLFFHDPDNGAVGIAHAGWQGTQRRIAQVMVREMTAAFGTRPEQLRVGIGPNISLSAYEVGEDFLLGFDDPDYFRPYLIEMPSGRWHFDMVRSNHQLLVDAGVDPNRIEWSGECTYSDPVRFFSYRRQGEESGRMSGLIRCD